MAQSHDARLAELVAELGGDEVRFLFRDLVEKALQELIDAELTEAIGAAPHERTETRTNQRNGSRPRVLSTPAGDVELRIRRRNLETGVYAGASTTAISFNTDYDWSPQGATVTEPSFEGVLAHEIGHTLGLGHSGQTLWSDENQRTTMVASSSPANTDLQETITRDEWAGAANVAGHASNKIPFLTPNPGFERNLSHWAIDGAVSVGSAYARTGSRGVRLSSNSFVWAGSSYDPWVVADGTQSGANHMSTGIVPFTIRADVRHPVTTTGGVQLRWNRRYLNYGPANGKVDGHTTVGAWQGQEFIQPVCDPSGTSWLSCGRGFSRQFNSTTDAWMIRVLALSTSGGYVYIDRFGYFGGTS